MNEDRLRALHNFKIESQRRRKLLDEIQKSDQVQKINQPKQAPQLKPHQRKKILETLLPAKQQVSASK